MNVPFCLRQASRAYPNNIAVDHEGRRQTYRELYRRALKSAGALAALGVEKGDRVALLMLNSPAYLELYYSIAIAGGIVVPLNTRWNASDVEFALNDSGTTFLFVDDKFKNTAAPLACRVIHGGAEYEALVETANARVYDDPDENELAGLFYTSGTTGGPKGAMLTHRNVFTNVMNCGVLAGAAHSRWLHAAPMFHLADAGLLHSITLTGGSHSFLSAFDPEAFLGAIERYRISGTLLVPTMINMLLSHATFGSFDISSLRRIVYGASPMPLPLMRSAIDKIACEFVPGFGMTETSPLLTLLMPEDHSLENSDRQFAPVKSAGRPVACAEVRVVDNEDRETASGRNRRSGRARTQRDAGLLAEAGDHGGGAARRLDAHRRSGRV